MQVILASAKTMRERCPHEGIVPYEPMFIEKARMLAHDMSRLSATDLSELLSCSQSIAETNRQRFSIFGTEEAEVIPAIFAYNGQAYRHLRADDMTIEELEYAQRHLWISSCLYGLLRPLDGINCYRMEGGYTLPSTRGLKVSDFWKNLATDILIESVKADDGILVYLDTEEFRSLFDWKRIIEEITVITPEFHVIRDGRKTTPSVWSKSCRGAMARYIIRNRIERSFELHNFTFEGFSYDSGEDYPMYVRKFSVVS